MNETFDAEFSSVPANRLLGLRLDAVTDAGARVSMDPGPQHIQETGVVHGGLLSSLADTACVYALRDGLPARRTLTSIEFKINFLAPARAGETIVAQARRVRRGGTIGVCDVDLDQSGILIARGLFTYLILEAR